MSEVEPRIRGQQAWHRLTRRAFLRSTGLATSLTALSGLSAVPALTSEGASGSAPFLSEDDTEVLTQIVERMVASDASGAPPVRETGAIAAIERLLQQLDPSLTQDLPLAIRLFDWGPIVFDFTFTRFVNMDAEAQDESIRCWMSSRISLRREAYAALRNLALLGYYSQDEVWPGIGYRGPLLKEGVGS
ncbi:MAG: hypothetical protein GY723_19125 [bacterium]|nr:hypothetical protein [bacterium]MCP5068259.1 hypothetical protein [bacterium]